MRDAHLLDRWVPGEWLRTWADSEQDVPMDSTSILCSHGALDPGRIAGWPVSRH